jgi:hypothetical protein
VESESRRRSLTVLKAILAAEMLSTAIHYTDNFVAVNRYPGPSDLYTPTRVAIVVSWPLLTWIGLIGYRRYREGRLHEARVCLAVYSLTGLVTLGHFIYGNPKIPAFFYATLFTDALTGLAALAFALWCASSAGPRPSRPARGIGETESLSTSDRSAAAAGRPK